MLISYDAQKNSIIESTLEYNNLYATKLADTTERFLKTTFHELAYSADIIGKDFSNKAVLAEEVRRLQRQSDNFNSVLVIDAAGTVRDIWPNIGDLRGRQIDTDGTREALRERHPLVDRPFTSAAGNFVIFISYPIVGVDGRYLGYVGGTIHLHKPNILNALLGVHPYKDGSYLYVVDQDRRLIYHPDRSRIGELVGANDIIDLVLQGDNGTRRTSNSRGVDMLAGYAVVPTAGWGIVAQRPTAAALGVLDQWLLDVARNALPLIAISVAGIWWLSRLIASPLWRLAKNARQIDTPVVIDEVQDIPTWYYEAAQLKSALLTGLGLVHHKIDKLAHDVLTDPLTGLHNRRGMELVLKSLDEANAGCSIIALDIDHFKQVNDRYGHAVGDLVLKTLAGHLTGGARDGDTICRVGGEEFLILLPHTEIGNARQIAERLRRRVAEAQMPVSGCITISLGVAHSPSHGGDIRETIKLADAMLYEAKNTGRNRVVVASPLTSSSKVLRHTLPRSA